MISLKLVQPFSDLTRVALCVMDVYVISCNSSGWEAFLLGSLDADYTLILSSSNY